MVFPGAMHILDVFHFWKFGGPKDWFKFWVVTFKIRVNGFFDNAVYLKTLQTSDLFVSSQFHVKIIQDLFSRHHPQICFICFFTPMHLFSLSLMVVTLKISGFAQGWILGVFLLVYLSYFYTSWGLKKVILSEALKYWISFSILGQFSRSLSLSSNSLPNTTNSSQHTPSLCFLPTTPLKSCHLSRHMVSFSHYFKWEVDQTVYPCVL